MAQRRFIADWAEMERRFHLVSRCCYRWVSDESIREALERGHFDDLTNPHNPHTHRAARIATIVRRLLDGDGEPRPITLVLVGSEIHVPDGHHCWRAHEFLGRMHAVPVALQIGWDGGDHHD